MALDRDPEISEYFRTCLHVGATTTEIGEAGSSSGTVLSPNERAWMLMCYAGVCSRLDCRGQGVAPQTRGIFSNFSSKFLFPRLTISSAMAERPRELNQRFQGGVNLKLNYRLKGYYSRHCDLTQFTLTHHMVIKQFLLLGLTAE